MLVKINVRRTTKLAKGNKNVRNRIVHRIEPARFNG